MSKEPHFEHDDADLDRTATDTPASRRSDRNVAARTTTARGARRTAASSRWSGAWGRVALVAGCCIVGSLGFAIARMRATAPPDAMLRAYLDGAVFWTVGL